MAIYRAGETLPFEVWYLERLDMRVLDRVSDELLNGNVRYGSDADERRKLDFNKELGASWAKYGQIEPVCVWGHEEGLLRIMVGHNRALAAADAGDPFLRALVSIRLGFHATLNDLCEPESLIEEVTPLTIEALRAYFKHEPRSMNLNRRGWGVTPAATETF